MGFYLLTKQVFIMVLSFGRSLAKKCVFLINEPCMINLTLIYLKPIELKYDTFMINLYKCNGSCNVADDLSTKIFVPSKTKDVNVKVFNMVTGINEAKILIKRVSCDCKCKFNNTTLNSNKKWNDDKCPCKCKKDYSKDPSICVCGNRRDLKRFVKNSMLISHG